MLSSLFTRGLFLSPRFLQTSHTLTADLKHTDNLDTVKPSQCYVVVRTVISPALRRTMAMVDSAECPVENQIKSKLTERLEPVHLEILNESFMHNVPKGSETHFKVIVVTDKFDKLSLVQRHRLVNTSLREELEGGVHALSIHAKTPEQWAENNTVKQSPACRGGSGL